MVSVTVGTSTSASAMASASRSRLKGSSVSLRRASNSSRMRVSTMSGSLRVTITSGLRLLMACGLLSARCADRPFMPPPEGLVNSNHVRTPAAWHRMEISASRGPPGLPLAVDGGWRNAEDPGGTWYRSSA